jgi:hypothetical protein
MMQALLRNKSGALRLLMLTKGGRKALFHQAEQEYSDENMRFLLALELAALRMRRSSNVSHAFRVVQEASEARDIIKDFIAVGAPREVNLSAVQRASLMTAFADLSERATATTESMPYSTPVPDAADDETEDDNGEVEPPSFSAHPVIKDESKDETASNTSPLHDKLNDRSGDSLRDTRQPHVQSALELFEPARDEVFRLVQIDLFNRFIEHTEATGAVFDCIFAEVDVDGDGSIQTSEFISWAKQVPGCTEIFGALFDETTAAHTLPLPTQAETLKAWGGRLKIEGNIYSKHKKVHAMLAQENGVLDTVVNGMVQARKTYSEGDYIMCGSRGGRYPMSAVDFSARYNVDGPEPASDQALAAESFFLYPPTGKIWALEVAADEAVRYFPAGHFIGKWGRPIGVNATDFLVMPHPDGNEIYRIKKPLFDDTYRRTATGLL